MKNCSQSVDNFFISLSLLLKAFNPWKSELEMPNSCSTFEFARTKLPMFLCLKNTKALFSISARSFPVICRPSNSDNSNNNDNDNNNGYNNGSSIPAALCKNASISFLQKFFIVISNPCKVPS